MPRDRPHPRTIFHLLPISSVVSQVVGHADNEAFVSRCVNKDAKTDDPKVYGLEVGYHVPTRPYPEVITKLGRDADLI